MCKYLYTYIHIYIFTFASVQARRITESSHATAESHATSDCHAMQDHCSSEFEGLLIEDEEVGARGAPAPKIE